MSVNIRKIDGTPTQTIPISDSFEEFQTQVNKKLGSGYVIMFKHIPLTHENFDQFKMDAPRMAYVYAIRPTFAAGAAVPEDGKKKRKRTSKRRSLKRRSSKRRSLKRRSSK